MIPNEENAFFCLAVKSYGLTLRLFVTRPSPLYFGVTGTCISRAFSCTPVARAVPM